MSQEFWMTMSDIGLHCRAIEASLAYSGTSEGYFATGQEIPIPVICYHTANIYDGNTTKLRPFDCNPI